MRPARLVWLCLLGSYASLCAGRDPPATTAAAAVQQPGPAQSAPPQQGPSQPLPVQPPPGSLPGGGQQAPQVAQQAAAVEENADWAVTLERIASSVVSINVDSTRAFDTEWNSTAQATGFVVDAEREIGRAHV